MEDSSEGESPLGPSSAQPSVRAGIIRIEHAVITKAQPRVSWQIFTDWKRWSRISNRYQEIQWYGRPWSPGSRMRVELLRPFEVTVDRVITACVPGKSLAWINHVIGYTMEQWVFFQPVAGGGTRIFTWLEFTGPQATIDGRSVQEFIEEYINEWYEAFRLECDRAVMDNRLS